MRKKETRRERLRQMWLRDFENAILAQRPEIRQRADFWDTGIHLFNQGVSAAAAASRLVERARQEESRT